MKNYKLYIGIVFLIFVVGGLLILFYYNYNDKPDEIIINGNKNNKSEIKKDINKKEEKEEIYYYVDIKGAINNPNVYKVLKESRIIDVINMAGGLREDADTSIINLSKKITDEMFIVIYTKDELQKYKEQTISTEEIKKKIDEDILSVDKNNDAEETHEENKKEDTKLVNINTASKEELLTINGIGESKAESIIKYREENGEFKAIEEIENVPGIGEALFEKVKEYITL